MYTTLEHAGTTLITVGTVVGSATTIESTGAPFEEGARGLLKCLLYAKHARNSLEFEVPCSTSVAPDGDERWYTMSKHADRESGIDAPAERWTLMGGIGRYAHVSGQCNFESTQLEDEGVTTTGRCTWTRGNDRPPAVLERAGTSDVEEPGAPVRAGTNAAGHPGEALHPADGGCASADHVRAAPDVAAPHATHARSPTASGPTQTATARTTPTSNLGVDLPPRHFNRYLVVSTFRLREQKINHLRAFWR